jgi:hypothetical protein
MPPPILIELGLEALRHPRRFTLRGLVAARAGHAGGSALAGERAVSP